MGSGEREDNSPRVSFSMVARTKPGRRLARLSAPISFTAKAPLAGAFRSLQSSRVRGARQAGTKLRYSRYAVKKKSLCVSKESEEKMWECGEKRKGSAGQGTYFCALSLSIGECSESLTELPAQNDYT